MHIKAITLKSDLEKKWSKIDRCLIGVDLRLIIKLDIIQKEDTGEELN